MTNLKFNFMNIFSMWIQYYYRASKIVKLFTIAKVNGFNVIKLQLFFFPVVEEVTLYKQITQVKLDP